MSVKPIPEGYHTVTPYITVSAAAEVIRFLEAGLGARLLRKTEAEGRIANAELKLGDSMIMIGQSHGDWPPMPCQVYLYVENVDTLYRQALAAGATSLLEPCDQFYGDRNAGVKDMAGNHWWIASRIEEVSDEEIARRMQTKHPQGRG